MKAILLTAICMIFYTISDAQIKKGKPEEASKQPTANVVFKDTLKIPGNYRHDTTKVLVHVYKNNSEYWDKAYVITYSFVPANLEPIIISQSAYTEKLVPLKKEDYFEVKEYKW